MTSSLVVKNRNFAFTVLALCPPKGFVAEVNVLYKNTTLR